MIFHDTQFGPTVTQGNEAHVHHLVVTLCTGLNDSHVGNGADCESDTVAFQVQQCRGGVTLAAWAVGGEVSVVHGIIITLATHCSGIVGGCLCCVRLNYSLWVCAVHLDKIVCYYSYTVSTEF